MAGTLSVTDEHLLCEVLGGEDQLQPSIRSAPGEGIRATWLAARRSSCPLFAPLPLPIGFALPDAALFRYFLQRGFFIGLFFGHDFAYALGDAHGLGCGRNHSLFGFRDQECDLAFYVSTGFELFENLSCTPTQEFFVDLCYLAGDDHVPRFS